MTAMPPSPASPVSPADYESLASFRHTLNCFLHFSAEASRRAGLAPQQHQALLAIKGFPGRAYVTVTELAERLQLRHNSAVGLVDRLASHKFVRRDQSTEDRRRVHVSITPQGEAALAKLATVHREELRRVGPELRRRLAALIEE